MLYLGGSMVAGILWPPKQRDPNAPLEIPPLDQVRGRTSYRDDSLGVIVALLMIAARVTCLVPPPSPRSLAHARDDISPASVVAIVSGMRHGIVNGNDVTSQYGATVPICDTRPRL